MSDLLYYIISCLLVTGVIIGLSLMSKVKRAVVGNAVSAICVAAAIILTMIKYDILPMWLLWASIAVGVIISFIWISRVKMIGMPQLVALYNGFGGAASAFVAILALINSEALNIFSLVTAATAMSVGIITLSGSFVAAGKLARIIPSKQYVLKGHSTVMNLNLALIIAAIVIVGINVANIILMIVLCSILSIAFGIVFSIRVGGADMPITISLLNSLSGVAGAIAGLAINDILLVTIGGIVGASGLLLTQIMCRAMNRKLRDILFGTKKKGTVVKISDEYKTINNDIIENSEELKKQADISEILKNAKSVIIIPGYGMALAQAQQLVRELYDKLEQKGAEVRFAIHPVAGRMPGHMNVLLCEVDVPYDKLYELESINDDFETCDLTIIIGANDVVNPAARDKEDTPIYGMPVLNADLAKHVIICNYDLKPGYAGVNNPLYQRKIGISFMLGDAKDSVKNLIKDISL